MNDNDFNLTFVIVIVAGAAVMVAVMGLLFWHNETPANASDSIGIADNLEVVTDGERAFFGYDTVTIPDDIKIDTTGQVVIEKCEQVYRYWYTTFIYTGKVTMPINHYHYVTECHNVTHSPYQGD